MLDDFENMVFETSGAKIFARKSGHGPPLLLLHGYPQTHLMWHKIAPRLAENFKVVTADLRGYGYSSKPKAGPGNINYSKRAMAQDMVEVMEALGFKEFFVAGHDRGARVTHRLAADHPDRVKKAAVLDIAPTFKMYQTADMGFGLAYWHWFFFVQPNPIPEKMIGSDPDWFLRNFLQNLSRNEETFPEEVLLEYSRCFSNPETIRASCDDYRAAATVDLKHDAEDIENGRKVICPLLVLWGEKGFVGKKYEVLETWEERATDVRGEAVPSGHFLPEEAPEETYRALFSFFTS